MVMLQFNAVSAVFAPSVEIVQLVTTAVVTIALVFLVVVIVGFTLVARRRKHRTVPSAAQPPLDAITTRANIELVTLDDALAVSTQELGFAIAQFGEQRAASFAQELTDARTSLTEAFRLKQQLDDEIPDSMTKQREFNGRIISLCDNAQKTLAAAVEEFDRLRREESNAPAELRAARLLIVTTSMRVPAAMATLAKLAAQYSPAALNGVETSVVDARELLKSAGELAGAAETLIASPTESELAASRVQNAVASAHTAVQLIDGLEQKAVSLARDTDRLAQLTEQCQHDLTEARGTRDSAPDPQTGGAIGAAMATLEDELIASEFGDPVSSITRLQHAVMLLDRSLAEARNQAERLQHARAALEGVLISATSQIEATQSYVDSHRVSVKADARTRLAEAKRLLDVARADTDPVSALDTARSSATYSRDADALARYSARG